jgi:hypothetical protein
MFALTGRGVLFAVVSSAATAVGLVLALRWLRARHGASASPRLEYGLVALAIGWGIVSGTYAGGHPAELVIPLSWAVAGECARRSRPWPAGLVLGLAAGWETWAALGVPVLLLAPQLRQVARSGVAAAVVATGIYAPFLIAGPFRMGAVSWRVEPQTLVHQLAPALVGFDWTARLVQATVVVGVAAAVALLARRRPQASGEMVWLLPAVLVLAKITTDPAPRNYYWVPLQAALLLGIASARRPNLPVACASAVLLLALVMPLQLPALEVAATVALAVGAAIGPAPLRPRTSGTAAATHVPGPEPAGA